MLVVNDRVRILLASGIISPNVYLVEEDNGGGKMKLVREDTVGSNHVVHVLINSDRVFPYDIVQRAPVIHMSPEVAVAHCPTCGEQHDVHPGDESLSCNSHGTFTLFRTKEHVSRVKHSTLTNPPKKETKKMETKTVEQEVAVATVSEPVAEAPAVEEVAVTATNNALDMDAIKALGEVWTKRLEFDYPHIDAKSFVLLTDINGVLFKHCFNTYNGSLGKKDNNIARFQATKGAYAVKDVAKAREQLTTKGYTLLV